uniref:Cilia- and flagella-associated protein 206 n=1 Tax=Labrus bergylta TaxID=56723 RepID=A0A3Q3FD85_9LABR
MHLKPPLLIKNIIGDIVRECAVRGHAVSETLVAFMVTVVLDPRNGFNVDRILTKQDVQKLKEVSLLHAARPATIKMQVCFDLNYTSRRKCLCLK